MIKIEQLHKRFKKNEVLKGIDLEISTPGILAILGPNGSGKTTLIKSILGMVIPDQGAIYVNDLPIKRSWKYRQQIDYLPQIANFPTNLTVKELIKMIQDLRGTPNQDTYLIEWFQLTPFLNKKLSQLSGGTQQKVNLVITLMFDSDLVILDEPTTGLDPIALLGLKELLMKYKNRGKTIVITTHIMSFVEEMADEIILILEGKVYFRGDINALKEKTSQKDFEHAIAHILKNNSA